MSTTVTLTAAEALTARRMVMSGLVAADHRNSRHQPWELLVERAEAEALLAKLLGSE